MILFDFFCLFCFGWNSVSIVVMCVCFALGRELYMPQWLGWMLLDLTLILYLPLIVYDVRDIKNMNNWILSLLYILCHVCVLGVEEEGPTQSIISPWTPLFTITSLHTFPQQHLSPLQTTPSTLPFLSPSLALPPYNYLNACHLELLPVHLIPSPRLYTTTRQASLLSMKVQNVQLVEV